MNNNVRKITDGAMMTALLGLLLVINRQLGGVVELFVWILPLPMVFFTAKYGWKDGLLPFSAMIFLTLIFGTPQSIFYFGVTATTGLIYGEGVKQKWTSRRLMLIAMTISVVSNLVTTVLFASFFGYDIAMEAQTMKQVINQTLGTSVAALPFDIDQMIRIAVIFSVFLTGVLEGLLIHLFSRLLLARLGFQIPKPKPLSQISSPKWLGYVAIICWAGSEFLLKTPQDAKIQELMMILDIASNLYLMFFGYIGALVLGAAKFQKNISFYLIFAIIFLLPVAIPALSLFGFLYITTNWRVDLLRRVQSGENK
ncbi:DUF2232 domain-containing protein [Anaerorhabdus sp.]|uniref:DUF2232 domain-containing protein n=1 Tax=Anaerorhabdus sp. TaxID=1872524 RepID=UPI002FC98F8A